MTEQEWLECDDPQTMLGFLRDRASERKLRLFSVARCRVLWRLFTHRASRTAIEVAERFADDPSLRDDLLLAFNTVDGLFDPDGEPNMESQLALAVCDETPDAAWVVRGIEVLPSRRTRFRGIARPRAVLRRLHDIFGNPFRLVACDLAWRTVTVVSLATAIYDDLAFDRLPILADALEDAGCDNADILNHCRQPGEHVRGCWVVDAALGAK